MTTTDALEQQAVILKNNKWMVEQKLRMAKAREENPAFIIKVRSGKVFYPKTKERFEDLQSRYSWRVIYAKQLKS